MYNASTTCAITLNSNGFTRTNYSFQGYGTGTASVTHNAGTSYSFSNNTTLYAIWKSIGIPAADKIINAPGIIAADPDKNSRYVGKDPNNYVSFNGELWRIIGVFGGRVKIVKNEILPESMQYNTADYDDLNNTIVSDWERSYINKYLNTTYYNTLNITYKDMVENATWRIGGAPTSEITAAQMYAYEGNTKGPSSSSLTTKSYIGLINVSDYGYASSGCYNGQKVLYDYESSICTSTNWLFVQGKGLMTMNPFIANVTGPEFIHVVDYIGLVDHFNVDNHYYVRPALYLKSTVKITGGSGTKTDPYTLAQ